MCFDALGRIIYQNIAKISQIGIFREIDNFLPNFGVKWLEIFPIIPWYSKKYLNYISQKRYSIPTFLTLKLWRNYTEQNSRKLA